MKAMCSTILFLAEPSKAHDLAHDALASDPGYRVILAAKEAEAAEAIGREAIDLVLADVDHPGLDAITFLFHLRFSHPDLLRILMIGAQPPTVLRDALVHTAAYQYLSKPIEPEQCILVVRRALETRELARRHRRLVRALKIRADSPILDGREHVAAKESSLGGQLAAPRPFAPAVPRDHFEKLVYASKAMAALCDLARKAAQTDLPILIEGETGTGKELLARAVHFHSCRRASPLMVQNCGGIRDEVLQSELFGHKRGAFTGAMGDRLGLFRAADGGTVFLDEISEVSEAFQVSLLRFLQEGEVKPLGSDKILHADVRIIAASNKPLKQLVACGRFRQDLYFRLKGVELVVPPLRERRDDIPVLADYFLRKHGAWSGLRVTGLWEEVIERLKSYRFPGNVRELETEIRRMIALGKDRDLLMAGSLSPPFAGLPLQTPDPTLGQAGQGADLQGVNLQSVTLQGATLQGATLKEMVERLEGELVGKVLEKHQWNQSKAARELGLSRVGLANKIRRYALSEGSLRTN